MGERARRALAIGILCLGAAAAGPVAIAGNEEEPEPPVRVRVDPRVELLSLVFRLAGSPEYGRCRVPAYAAAADAHFSEFREHEVVALARELRRTRGVSYDAVMSLAVHLDGVESLTPVVSLRPWPDDLDRRWTEKDVERFLAAARRFAKEADFAAFSRRHEKLYATAVARMEALVGEDAGFDWFDRFFGPRVGVRFHLVPGLLNGPNCYGLRVVHCKPGVDGYCVLGVWEVDDEGAPVFTRDMLPTVAHEFCHSYVNPLVERHRKSLEGAGERIFARVREAMERQAYGDWETMVKESLVRACVVRYVFTTQGEAAGRKEAEAQFARSFVWVPALAGWLRDYEKDREKYPTLEEFMPRVVEFFDAFAEKYEQVPTVVSMVPENGAGDVDPGLIEIRITFDRPMRDGSWSVVGGGPKFPQLTGKPRYDEARKVLTLPVALEPEHDYEFWLNRGKFTGFASEKGVPLEPFRVTFTTGKAR